MNIKSSTDKPSSIPFCTEDYRNSFVHIVLTIIIRFWLRNPSVNESAVKTDINCYNAIAPLKNSVWLLLFQTAVSVKPPYLVDRVVQVL